MADKSLARSSSIDLGATVVVKRDGELLGQRGERGQGQTAVRLILSAFPDRHRRSVNSCSAVLHVQHVNRTCASSRPTRPVYLLADMMLLTTCVSLLICVGDAVSVSPTLSTAVACS